MKKFFVLSLPRSGTAWLANFLTWGDSFCYHEISQGCESLDDIESAFKKTDSPIVGSADTAAVVFFDKLVEKFPSAKFLFVVRSKADVAQAMQFNGFDPSGLDMIGNALADAIRREGIDSATIPFNSLFSQHGMREVWGYLGIPNPFPWRRFELLREMNMQDVTRAHSETPYAHAKISMNMHRFGSLVESMYPAPRQGMSYSGNT